MLNGRDAHQQAGHLMIAGLAVWAMLGGAFLLIFCALGSLSEVFLEWREERRAHRVLRDRIRRWTA